MQINIGSSLRVAQAKAQVNSSDLARAFKVHPQQIMRWRNSRDMKISLALKFANHFSVSLADFIKLGEDNG